MKKTVSRPHIQTAQQGAIYPTMAVGPVGAKAEAARSAVYPSMARQMRPSGSKHLMGRGFYEEMMLASGGDWRAFFRGR